VVPLHDNNPTRTTPLVVYALIGVNIAVFLGEMSLSDRELRSFFHAWAIVPQELTASFSGSIASPVPEWLTLFTSQFLHGGILHIAGNMLFLWIFGNNIEDKLGHIKFLIFYLTCGALAGLSQWVFATDSSVPTLGASGAIAGVMGAYLIRFPRSQILTLVPLGPIWTTVRLPAFAFLVFWFVQQAISSIATLGIEMEGGGVAYWAHAGGFVFGAILGPLMGVFDDRQ